MTVKESKQSTPKWYYAVLAGIPVLFFVLLEFGLRLGGYGETYEVFVELSDAYPGVLFLNPSITAKYFPQLKNTPGVIPDGFDREKSPDAYRVFVLGESSAAGWPYIPNASFPRYLKRRLELSYPDRIIEVVNMGISAINSYTLRDMLPAVLKQKPDLILIYTGHNEYYGALGVGSTQSLGGARPIINFLLSIQHFRTVQLVQNTIRGIFSAVVSKDAASGGQNETLMARVIGENLIPLNSALYENGLKQFEGNMRDILAMCADAKVPVLIGNLTCNLKDMKPFAPVAAEGSRSADGLFASATKEREAGNNAAARKLFLQARDADALRFRAPSAVNATIQQLAGEFSIPMVDIEQLFNSLSPSGITGNELMVDHLHPNTTGYALMGKAFWDAMLKHNLLPKSSPAVQPYNADSLLSAQFPFTALDSVIADIRIRILTGGYPFVPRGSKNKLIENFTPKYYRDTLAMMVTDKDITIEDAHYRMADRCFAGGDITGFEKELLVLIADRGMNPQHYRKLCQGLVNAGQAARALPYLYRLDKLLSDEFSNKWIGSILLQQGKAAEAIPHLERSTQFEPNDPQVWYNLSGAYYNTGNVNKSVEALKSCLQINPRYQEARAFYFQLKRAYGLP